MELIEMVAKNFGLPVALIVALSVVISRVLMYCAKRLFDEKEGVVTKAVEKHIESIDKITTIQSAQHIDLIELKKNLSELILLHKDERSNVSNKRLHDAGLVACDILIDISTEIGVDIKDDMKKIRMILNGQ